jgi:DNA-directed RNA polymerase subunit H
MAFDISTHNLVPRHEVLNEKQVKQLLEEYHVILQKLPKILKDDPSIEQLTPNVGDVIKITRTSRSAGVATYYRVVING